MPHPPYIRPITRQIDPSAGMGGGQHPIAGSRIIGSAMDEFPHNLRKPSLPLEEQRAVYRLHQIGGTNYTLTGHPGHSRVPSTATTSSSGHIVLQPPPPARAVIRHRLEKKRSGAAVRTSSRSSFGGEAVAYKARTDSSRQPSFHEQVTNQDRTSWDGGMWLAEKQSLPLRLRNPYLESGVTDPNIEEDQTHQFASEPPPHVRCESTTHGMYEIADLASQLGTLVEVQTAAVGSLRSLVAGVARLEKRIEDVGASTTRQLEQLANQLESVTAALGREMGNRFEVPAAPASSSASTDARYLEEIQTMLQSMFEDYASETRTVQADRIINAVVPRLEKAIESTVSAKITAAFSQSGSLPTGSKFGLSQTGGGLPSPTVIPPVASPSYGMYRSRAFNNMSMMASKGSTVGRKPGGTTPTFNQSLFGDQSRLTESFAISDTGTDWNPNMSTLPFSTPQTSMRQLAALRAAENTRTSAANEDEHKQSDTSAQQPYSDPYSNAAFFMTTYSNRQFDPSATRHRQIPALKAQLDTISDRPGTGGTGSDPSDSGVQEPPKGHQSGPYGGEFDEDEERVDSIRTESTMLLQCSDQKETKYKTRSRETTEGSPSKKGKCDDDEAPSVLSFGNDGWRRGQQLGSFEGKTPDQGNKNNTNVSRNISSEEAPNRGDHREVASETADGVLECLSQNSVATSITLGVPRGGRVEGGRADREGEFQYADKGRVTPAGSTVHVRPSIDLEEVIADVENDQGTRLGSSGNDLNDEVPDMMERGEAEKGEMNCAVNLSDTGSSPQVDAGKDHGSEQSDGSYHQAWTDEEKGKQGQGGSDSEMLDLPLSLHGEPGEDSSNEDDEKPRLSCLTSHRDIVGDQTGTADEFYYNHKHHHSLVLESLQGKDKNGQGTNDPNRRIHAISARYAGKKTDAPPDGTWPWQQERKDAHPSAPEQKGETRGEGQSVDVSADVRKDVKAVAATDTESTRAENSTGPDNPRRQLESHFKRVGTAPNEGRMPSFVAAPMGTEASSRAVGKRFPSIVGGSGKFPNSRLDGASLDRMKGWFEQVAAFKTTTNQESKTHLCAPTGVSNLARTSASHQSNPSSSYCGDLEYQKLKLGLDDQKCQNKSPTTEEKINSIGGILDDLGAHNKNGGIRQP